MRLALNESARKYFSFNYFTTVFKIIIIILLINICLNPMINILIVAHQKSVGQALQVYLNAESDLQVVGFANNGKNALEKIAQLQPDIVLIDLKIPKLDGLKTTQIIRDRFPQTKTIVFSDHSDHNELYNAIAAGAKGYLRNARCGASLYHQSVCGSKKWG